MSEELKITKQDGSRVWIIDKQDDRNYAYTYSLDTAKEIVSFKEQLSLQKEVIERLIEVGNNMHDFCEIDHKRKECDWTEALAFAKERLG